MSALQSDTINEVIEECIREGDSKELARWIAFKAAVEHAIGFAKGMTAGVRNALMLAAARRFGPPSDEVSASIKEIDDRARLERLVVKLSEATDWDDLLKSQ